MRRKQPDSIVRLGTIMVALLATALLSVACGEVDGPAEVDLSVENREDIAVSAADALARIVSAGQAVDGLSFLIPSSAGSSGDDLANVDDELLPCPVPLGEGCVRVQIDPNYYPNLPSVLDMLPDLRYYEQESPWGRANPDDAGRLRRAFNPANATSAGEASICSDGTFTPTASGIIFNDCEIGNACTFDGEIDVDISSNGDLVSIEFVDLTVSCDDLPGFALAGEQLVCTGLSGDTPSCDVSLGSFTGIVSNRNLLIREFGIEEKEGGFLIDAVIVDSEYGLFEVSTRFDEPIVFDDCDGGVPEAGEIMILGSGDTVIGTVVEFDGCLGFEYCYFENDDDSIGDCEQVSWENILPEM